jgi:predicted nucleic acid-binding Zn ribbon protein
MKIIWTKEKCQEIANKYKSRSEFNRFNSSAYNKCLKMNWLDDVCFHMTYQHKPNNYWTKEKCQEIANKYKTRSEFRKNDSSVYRTAIANSWLNDICLHMKYINNYWNYYKCQEEALKYNNKS